MGIVRLWLITPKCGGGEEMRRENLACIEEIGDEPIIGIIRTGVEPISHMTVWMLFRLDFSML
jgi:hypothetical protein